MMGKISPGKIVLSVVVGVAVVLRWWYIREISLFVDEFVTAWAARNVLAHPLWLPIFPSGNFYPHGLLFTYLEVPFVLGAFGETMVRIPALIVSLASVVAIYGVGRRLFSESVGLIAAAALAVGPDCIIWGGRARMYGLLQLLTLLVIFFFHRGLIQDRPRDRYMAMGLLVAALFTHAEAVLLLPVLGLTAFIVWPWRRLIRVSVILPFSLGALGAVALLLMAYYGQPGHLETLQQSRPYLAFPIDLVENLQAFAPVLVRPYHLPFTLLAVAGLLPPLHPYLNKNVEEWGHSPLTYLYTVLILFLALFVLLVGATWRNERYLFLLLPILFLIGGEVLIALLDRVTRSLRSPFVLRRAAPWRGSILALLVILFVGLTGRSTAYRQEPGYDLAFRHLRDQWQPESGDLVVTFAPAASMLYLEQCDYFAVQRDYQAYVVTRPGDGRPSDLWTATPLLNSTARFVELLASTPRVWFVIDKWRFQTRYEPGFILAVLEGMDLEYQEREVLIFRGKAYTAPGSPEVKEKRQAEFGRGAELRLTGFDLLPGSSTLNPEEPLDITLHWQAIAPSEAGYVASLDLVGPDGLSVTRTDEAVLRDLYHPTFWPEGATIPDHLRLVLPSNLARGRYRLDLALYHADEADQPLPVAGADRVALYTFSYDLE
jgi:4-amino-4-deoxy-L-arabinose transferase-like glycosyltransferase